MQSEEVTKPPKYLLGRITNKYIIMDIMFYSFFKRRGINQLFQTSSSFRQLLKENYKAANFYAEDPLDHIDRMPFTISQRDLPGPVWFVRLSGERVYTCFD